ncbi:MAG: HAMP domain-containing sensor histidine kinase [Cyanobacteria bacterium P01_E01_bin.45]
MAVFERLRMSMAVPMANLQERFRKQPATCATAIVLFGLAIPIGLSFKVALQTSESLARRYALAEAELAASRLDRSIAQFRTNWGHGEPDNRARTQVCLPQQGPLQDQFPVGFSLQLPTLARIPLPFIQGGFAPFSRLNVESAEIPNASTSAFDTLSTTHGDYYECAWLDPLPLESFASSLPAIGGELRSYWFMLDESGHPVLTPERLSSSQANNRLDGWSALDAGQWHELAQAMDGSSQGISSMMVGDRNMYVAHSRLEEAGWLLGLAIPHQDFERQAFYLWGTAWLVVLGGIVAATAVALSVTNYQQAELVRGDLRDRELRTERERLIWQARQQEQQEQIRVQRDETVKTISNSMTGPLTNLKQAITLLSDYGTTLHPTQFKGYTEVMEQAIGRLAHTFDRIISLRNLDSTSLAPRLTPVNLTQLCTDLVSRCREAKHTCIELSVCNECGTVYLDSYLIQVALEPILRNAIKYSGNHPELPPIELGVDCRTGDSIVFTVTDRGLGIPDADTDKVVQPFARGKNVYHIPGNGLGLAIAKQAIDAMDGQLLIESQLEMGTTVTVTVPIGRQLDPHPER